MRCKNQQCPSSHGRRRFLGYCANCAAGVCRSLNRWFRYRQALPEEQSDWYGPSDKALEIEAVVCQSAKP